MKSHYWIKLYHEILDDAKMGRLKDHLWRRANELFLMAGEVHNAGHLPSLADMAWRLRLDDEELLEDLHLLEEVHIVTQLDDGGWFVTNFADRQSAMSGAERQKRYRERQQKEQYYGNGTGNDASDGIVTQCNADVDVDVDVDKDIDKDVDVDGANDNPFSLYEQATASTLTQILAERIGDLVDECEEHRRKLPNQAKGASLTGEQWVCAAIREAADATNSFGIRYIAAILDRWREQGYDFKHYTKNNGKPKKRKIRPIMPDGSAPEIEVIA